MAHQSQARPCRKRVRLPRDRVSRQAEAPIGHCSAGWVPAGSGNPARACPVLRFRVRYLVKRRRRPGAGPRAVVRSQALRYSSRRDPSDAQRSRREELPRVTTSTLPSPGIHAVARTRRALGWESHGAVDGWMLVGGFTQRGDEGEAATHRYRGWLRCRDRLGGNETPRAPGGRLFGLDQAGIDGNKQWMVRAPGQDGGER